MCRTCFVCKRSLCSRTCSKANAQRMNGMWDLSFSLIWFGLVVCLFVCRFGLVWFGLLVCLLACGVCSMFCSTTCPLRDDSASQPTFSPVLKFRPLQPVRSQASAVCSLWKPDVNMVSVLIYFAEETSIEMAILICLLDMSWTHASIVSDSSASPRVFLNLWFLGPLIFEFG